MWQGLQQKILPLSQDNYAPSPKDKETQRQPSQQETTFPMEDIDAIVRNGRDKAAPYCKTCEEAFENRQAYLQHSKIVHHMVKRRSFKTRRVDDEEAMEELVAHLVKNIFADTLVTFVISMRYTIW